MTHDLQMRIQFDVVEIILLGLYFNGILLAHISLFMDLLLPVGRVVIEIHLRVATSGLLGVLTANQTWLGNPPGKWAFDWEDDLQNGEFPSQHGKMSENKGDSAICGRFNRENDDKPFSGKATLTCHCITHIRLDGNCNHSMLTSPQSQSPA